MGPLRPRCPGSTANSAICSLVAAQTFRTGTLGARGHVLSSPKCPEGAANSAIRTLVAARKSTTGNLGARGCLPPSPMCLQRAGSGATCSPVAARDFKNGTLCAEGCLPASPRCPKSVGIGATCSTAVAKECRHGSLGTGGCIPASPLSATNEGAEAPNVQRDVVPPHGAQLGHGRIDSLRVGAWVGPCLRGFPAAASASVPRAPWGSTMIPRAPTPLQQQGVAGLAAWSGSNATSRGPGAPTTPRRPAAHNSDGGMCRLGSGGRRHRTSRLRREQCGGHGVRAPGVLPVLGLCTQGYQTKSLSVCQTLGTIGSLWVGVPKARITQRLLRPCLFQLLFFNAEHIKQHGLMLQMTLR